MNKAQESGYPAYGMPAQPLTHLLELWSSLWKHWEEIRPRKHNAASQVGLPLRYYLYFPSSMSQLCLLSRHEPSLSTIGCAFFLHNNSLYSYITQNLCQVVRSLPLTCEVPGDLFVRIKPQLRVMQRHFSERNNIILIK